MSIRHPGERRRSCRGRSIVRGQPPARRGRMTDFNGRFDVEELAAARAETIVPPIPAPEFLITAQTGSGTGIGHTCDRCLVHGTCPLLVQMS
jgi:hypothetical protein